MSKSKAKGTAAETAVARFLEQNGWPYVERRSLAGALDKGDITGTPGLCWEVKAGATLCLPAWLSELREETRNSKASHGILVVKPAGIGTTRVGHWHAIMEGAEFEELLVVNTGPVFPNRIEPRPFLRCNLIAALSLRSEAFPVLDLVRRGLADQPDRNYQVMYLEHMVKLLRSAGYGSPLEEVS